MTETPPEVPVEPLEPTRLHTALLNFTSCVGLAPEAICTYSLTIGETYVPFDPDPDDECDEDEAWCSQVWVRVVDISPTETGLQGFDGGDDNVVELELNLEVGILRCIEVPEDGEAPVASDVMAAGLQAMTDMNVILCAALACDAFESLGVGQWTPMGPLGGQYGGTWAFTVQV